jgi:hypothetical protein
MLRLLQTLVHLIREKTDWYLDELVDAMKERTGKHVSVSTLWRSLKFCGVTRKKVEVFAARNFNIHVLHTYQTYSISFTKQQKNAMNCDAVPLLVTLQATIQQIN